MTTVNELVEWAKLQLEGYGYGVPVPYADEMVRGILSNPDHKLYIKVNGKYIDIAEALKEKDEY